MKKVFHICLLLMILSISLSINSQRELDPNALREKVLSKTAQISNDLLNQLETKIKSKHTALKTSHGVHPKLKQMKDDFKKKIMSRSKNHKGKMTNRRQMSFLHLNNKRFRAYDDPSSFFDGDFETSALNIPLFGRGKGDCWSGDYWQTRHLLIGARYDTGPTNTKGKWDNYEGYWNPEYTFAQASKIYSQPKEFNNAMSQGVSKNEYAKRPISPAEKYDMMCGDYDFTLTNWMKTHAKQFVGDDGDIPKWFGICHGWSPAATYYPEPKKSFNIQTSENFPMKILVDDVRAISTLFWAQADYETRFIGYPCPSEDPSKIKSDSVTGLYTDDQCSTIDPGSFAILLGNEMGINHGNVSFDPSPDGEIWNQPICSYEFSWYNLANNSINDDFSQNFTPVSKLRNSSDKFLNFLSSRVTSEVQNIVGLWATVNYAVENMPIFRGTPDGNYKETEDYLGAVFLDGRNNIVGGAWKYNHHPNFVWMPDPLDRPSGSYDSSAPEYDGTYQSLQKLTSYCKKASANGIPLRSIVERLINMSK